MAAIAIVLVIIIGVKSIFKDRPLVKAYGLVIDAVLYGTSLIFLALFFYQKHITIGIIMSLLCAVAVGKYLYDQYRVQKGE